VTRRTEILFGGENNELKVILGQTIAKPKEKLKKEKDSTKYTFKEYQERRKKRRKEERAQKRYCAQGGLCCVTVQRLMGMVCVIQPRKMFDTKTMLNLQ
jgi:hypothetical protein